MPGAPTLRTNLRVGPGDPVQPLGPGKLVHGGGKGLEGGGGDVSEGGAAVQHSAIALVIQRLREGSKAGVGE